MKRIINCETGEETLVPFTKAELAQQATDEAETLAAQAKLNAKAEAKAKAEGKLAALGVTTDDLRALGL
jgi:hypothetical protein